MTKICSRLQLLTTILRVVTVVASHDNKEMALKERWSSSWPLSSGRSSNSKQQGHEENLSSSSPQIPLEQQPEEYQHYYDFQAKLPRVEVQLLCSHDFPPDFDVADTFRHFYQEFFLAALSTTEENEKLSSNIGTYNMDVVDHVDDDASPFETELFTFVSRSYVDDVKPREDFYDLCDPTSTLVLITMDVRGYIRLRTNNDTPNNVDVHGPLDGFRIHDKLQQCMDKVDSSAIKEYFAQHVCSPFQLVADDHHNTTRNNISQIVVEQNSTGTAVVGTDAYSAIEYFKAKIKPWNNRLEPPPPSSSRDYPYPSTKDHRHFDHNLRLLCDGGVDAVYPNYHKQVYKGPDNIASLVIGMLVGTMMVVLILKELKQKRQPSIRYQQRQRELGQHGNRTTMEVDDVVSMARPITAAESEVRSSNSGGMELYEVTTQDETQLV
jgi:hypothetical protein